MRRVLVLLLSVLALGLAAAGCGGGDGEDSGATPPPPAATETTEDGTGDAANGEQVFASAGCGGCHTFSKAGSNGGGSMPAFKDDLSEQEIRDVAAFVSGA